MGILPDWAIRQAECIKPFEEGLRRHGVISYGVSSYGYDVRAGHIWKVFTNVYGAVVDPKAFDPKGFVEQNVEDYVLIPPNSFALCASIERISVPRDCLAIVIGKSTYARCGIVLNCTPLEPEWEGHITLEVSNTTPLPAKVYAGEGIGQVLFFRTDAAPCEISYADKAGKYQNQNSQPCPPKCD